MAKSNELTGVFSDLAELADRGDPLSVREVLEALEKRGSGPMLAVLALLLALPLGAVPGVPALIGSLFILISLRLVFHRRALWLPKRVRSAKVPHKALCASIFKGQSLARRVSPFVRKRWEMAVTARGSELVIATVLAIVGGSIIVLGFLPGLPMALALPILLIGIGMTAHDGVYVSGGVVLSLTALIWGVTHLAGVQA